MAGTEKRALQPPDSCPLVRIRGVRLTDMPHSRPAPLGLPGRGGGSDLGLRTLDFGLSRFGSSLSLFLKAERNSQCRFNPCTMSSVSTMRREMDVMMLLLRSTWA